MLEKRYTVGRLKKRLWNYILQILSFRKACQCPANTNILQPKIPMQFVLSPSTSHTPHTILFLAISLLSGSQLNSCLSPVIFIHLPLDYAFTSPNRIMPSYRKKASHSKALQHLCTTQPSRLSWKEEIHPYSLCKLSLSHSCCNNLHLISQLYQLQKKDYILDGKQLFNKYEKAIKKGRSKTEFSSSVLHCLFLLALQLESLLYCLLSHVTLPRQCTAL